MIQATERDVEIARIEAERDAALAKAEAYRKDWYSSKYEFGVKIKEIAKQCNDALDLLKEFTEYGYDREKAVDLLARHGRVE